MKKVILVFSCALAWMSVHATDLHYKKISAIHSKPANVVTFLGTLNTLAIANAKEKEISFYDGLSGQRIRKCKLDVSGDNLRMSSDQQFLLSDSSYAKMEGIASCIGIIPFHSVEGKKMKSENVLNTYPIGFVADINAKSRRFFYLEMTDGGPPKYYSGYVGVLNTKKKILEIGKDIHPRKKGEMAFPLSLMEYPKFSLDGMYLYISPQNIYPGIYETVSRKKVDADAPQIASRFDSDEKWKLVRNPENLKGLYVRSENLNYFVGDTIGVSDTAISKDGNLVAVVYADYDAWTTRIDIFCRDCE